MKDLISPMEYRYILMEIKRLEEAVQLSLEDEGAIALLKQMAIDYEQHHYDHSLSRSEHYSQH